MVGCRVLIMALLIVVVVNTVNSDRHMVRLENSTTVRLYNNSSDKEGVVQLNYNKKWNFINGNGWDYNGASAVCTTLGFRAVSAFYGSNITYVIPPVLDGELLDDHDVIPGFIKTLQCMSTTPISSECYIEFLTPAILFTKKQPSKAQSSGHAMNVELKNVAWVSCKAQLSTTPPTPTIDEAPLQMPVVLQESSHDISPGPMSMAVIMVIIFLGATLVVAINVVIVGMAYKHYSRRNRECGKPHGLASPVRCEGESTL